MPLQVLVLGQVSDYTKLTRIDIWLLGEFCNIRKRINNVKNRVARENATNSLVSVKSGLSRAASYIYCVGGCPSKHPLLISIVPRLQCVCERLKSEVSEGGNVSDSLDHVSGGPGVRRENGTT